MGRFLTASTSSFYCGESFVLHTESSISLTNCPGESLLRQSEKMPITGDAYSAGHSCHSSLPLHSLKLYSFLISSGLDNSRWYARNQQPRGADRTAQKRSATLGNGGEIQIRDIRCLQMLSDPLLFVRCGVFLFQVCACACACVFASGPRADSNARACGAHLRCPFSA